MTNIYVIFYNKKNYFFFYQDELTLIVKDVVTITVTLIPFMLGEMFYARNDIKIVWSRAWSIILTFFRYNNFL